MPWNRMEGILFFFKSGSKKKKKPSVEIVTHLFGKLSSSLIVFIILRKEKAQFSKDWPWSPQTAEMLEVKFYHHLCFHLRLINEEMGTPIFQWLFSGNQETKQTTVTIRSKNSLKVSVKPSYILPLYLVAISLWMGSLTGQNPSVMSKNNASLLKSIMKTK